MKPFFLCLMQAALLAACAQWPEQSRELDARAKGLAAPALLPQDQLLVGPDLQAEAKGQALATRAAALRGQAAGL